MNINYMNLLTVKFGLRWFLEILLSFFSCFATWLFYHILRSLFLFLLGYVWLIADISKDFFITSLIMELEIVKLVVMSHFEFYIAFCSFCRHKIRFFFKMARSDMMPQSGLISLSYTAFKAG